MQLTLTKFDPQNAASFPPAGQRIIFAQVIGDTAHLSRDDRIIFDGMEDGRPNHVFWLNSGWIRRDRLPRPEYTHWLASPAKTTDEDAAHVCA